jgi:hypothetical protein
MCVPAPPVSFYRYDVTKFQRCGAAAESVRRSLDKKGNLPNPFVSGANLIGRGIGSIAGAPTLDTGAEA